MNILFVRVLVPLYIGIVSFLLIKILVKKIKVNKVLVIFLFPFFALTKNGRATLLKIMEK